MKMKKFMACAAAGALLVSMLAGCGGDNADTNTATQAGSEEDLAYKVSDDPIELTFFYAGLNGTTPFEDDYPVFTEAARLTNVTLTGTVPTTNTDPYQAFNTMMASGELDDVVTANKSDFDQYAGQGAFIPLEELIEEYAPNIKAFLDEHPDVKKGITSFDGHIYFLPRYEDSGTAKGWYIRKDWLEALNLEEPQTVDEVYNVLKAFKEQDPNGNGQQDEVPFFNREGTMSDIYNLFGIRQNFSINEETGKVQYSKYVPEYKTAVENAAKWYAEGLIDQEIFTRGANSREELLGNNTGGMTHDWFTSTSSYNEKLQESVPGINFDVIAPPADINGDVWEDTNRTQEYVGWGISATNEYPEETIKYFDFWYTESGKRLYNYGVEGVHYNLIDGQPEYTSDFLATDKSMTAVWNENGMALFIGGYKEFNAERQFMSEEALVGMDLYTNNNYIKDAFPSLPFSEEERKVISDTLPAVQSYMDEQEQKWIMGTEDVNSTFDQYMETCKNLGMDDVLAAYDSAYQRYLSN